ncbi:MAG TPA: Gfo/Idh/MocA family oxidoreductase [Gemmataceae bacterium]|jgi:predicted dehydrogenase|nr:Gfo/Idh/MocA family oxidoreductase [Gemmataceae bacterium]
MTACVRVGVIGLGRRWRRRYKPALRALRQRFAVRAVCDQVRERATAQARRLRCLAVAGPTALLEHDDVDAVLLLDAQWFGLWPVGLACRFGKPVFCACSLERDDAYADALLQQVEQSRLPVMVAMVLRLAAETTRLREILETQLGPARRVLCDVIVPFRTGRATGQGSDGAFAAALLGGSGIALLDWCASLLGGEPARVKATGLDDGHDLLLDFGGGRGAEIRHRRLGNIRRLRLEVVAERGMAVAEFPGQLLWTAEDGRHVHSMSRRQPIGRVLLERFHQAVTTGLPPEPNLRDAHRALGWLRAGARSRDAGGWVDLLR